MFLVLNNNKKHINLIKKIIENKNKLNIVKYLNI